MGDGGRMEGGWKLSLLEAAQDFVPEETQVNRGLHHKTRRLRDNRVGTSVAKETLKSNLPEMISFENT